MKQLENLKDNFEIAKNNNKPKIPYFKNSVFAFIIGGLICLIGQLINDGLSKYLNLSMMDSSLYTTVILVFLGSFLTGIGVYDKIGRFAGAGSIVPITGFANSVVSCAMEFKPEGIVFGIGAKMFNVAGPVIVYGITSSWIYGLIYFFMTKY